MAEPRTPKRRIDEIGEESRRRILDAAEELFALKGFDRTSFVDVAASSGISRGSIPWHFRNKNGLLIAVVQRMISRYLSVDMSNPSAAAMREKMPSLRDLIRTGAAGLLTATLIEAIRETGSVHEQYVQFFRDRRESLTRWLSERDAAQGLETTQATTMAVVLEGAVLGIQLQWQLDPESVDLDEALDLFARIADARID